MSYLQNDRSDFFEDDYVIALTHTESVEGTADER
jgi:hypothetical protein